LKFVETPLPGLLIVELKPWMDERGYFVETYQAREFSKCGIHSPFVQDNHVSSSRGVLRGLHMQTRRPQAKLVRAVEGAVFDVAVDARRGSPGFGKWFGIELKAGDFRQFFIPQGFAHGYCVLSERAQVEYKVSDFYDPGGEITLLWNDPRVGVGWPLRDPILSPKDLNGRTLADLADSLPEFAG
jgi:dTDP-4-dehydrorhamnose 3,5-epimerase